MSRSGGQLQIPFNNAPYLAESAAAVFALLKSGKIAAPGPATYACEQSLGVLTGTRNFLVPSATHALEMCALLLNIQPGDEVIMPSFSFVSAANAFVLRGAQIRFAENDEFGNLSISDAARLITKKTKAILTTDYAGTSCDLDLLKSLCEANGIFLVEDSAQGIGASYKNRALGTLGHLGCFSFHATKNISSGEGGSLMVSDQNDWIERAQIIREKGTNRHSYLAGLHRHYSWVDIGSSYVLSEMCAAYLLPQLQDLERITQRRRQIWDIYDKILVPELASTEIKTLKIPDGNRSNGHIYALIFPNAHLRNDFISHMRGLGISCPFHYVPLHSSPYGKRFNPERFGDFKMCNAFSDGIARLPIFDSITAPQQSAVITGVLNWVANEKLARKDSTSLQIDATA